jgi:hypothetical protein
MGKQKERRRGENDVNNAIGGKKIRKKNAHTIIKAESKLLTGSRSRPSQCGGEVRRVPVWVGC